jgi:hypothetical protein
MKRYTETTKWRDPWFRQLSGQAKLLWIYILDHADDIGTFSFNLKLAAEDLKLALTDEHFQELASRLQKLREDKYHIPKFVHFHCGALLKTGSMWARRIMRILEDRGLVENEFHEWHYPSRPPALERVTEPKPQAADKKPAEDKQRERNPLMDALALHAEESDPAQVTGSKWKSIGTALAQIKKTAPNVTPEEIARRAANYRSQMPQATITANALAQHWARCDKPGTAQPRRQKSPDGEVPHPETPNVPFKHAEPAFAAADDSIL